MSLALVIAAFWAIAAPYADRLVGLEVPVRAAVEVVDHVVPGVVVAVLVGAAQLVSRGLPLAPALGVALGGFWMVATHIPLVLQAGDGAVSMAAAVWHTAPGVTVLALATAGAVRAWNDAEGS